MNQLRQVDQIHSAPRPHWVGDGFHVHPMFNHMVGDKRTDPFLMLDYAAPRQFASNAGQAHGVGQHPHKGFETITIAYQGEVAHRDSAGGGGVIKTGDVQWMTAGNGIIHEEFHSPEFSQRGGWFEMVQLWVNLPARDKGTPARYQHLANADIPVVTVTGEQGQLGTVRLIAGEWPDSEQPQQGLADTFTPINLWDMTIEPQQTLQVAVPQQHNLMLLVMRGPVHINDDPERLVGDHQLVTFAAESAGIGLDQLRISALDQQARVLLMSGTPINEPIVGYGPFVMNTEQEIRQAITDFNRGKFGRIDH